MNFRKNIYFYNNNNKNKKFKDRIFKNYQYSRGIIGRDTYLHKKFNDKYYYVRSLRRSALIPLTNISSSFSI